jgi:2-phospho-L-lactate guanylyltransferase (CobY/MobA/RfbA family)
MRATGTIVILAKAPVAGTVKTRLIPMLSVTQAAAVYSAMLTDVVRAAGEVPGARLVVCLRGAPAPPLPAADRLLVQRGPDLAHSIANGFVDVADRWGPGPCVLITSDIPTVRAADIQAVLNCLDEADVGFGPSPDGGF